MALVKVYKFREIGELNDFLSGGIVGGDVARVSDQQPGLPNLVGKTVTFTKPVGSCTFTVGSVYPDYLLPKDIKAQLEAAIPGLLVKFFGPKIVFVESTPSTGCVLAAGSYGGHAALIGTVDINGLAYGLGGTVDTLTLSLEIDGAAQPLITFAAPVNVAGLLAQINGVIAGATASVRPDGKLVITSASTGALSKVKILAGTSAVPLGYALLQSITGAAVNDGNLYLGFDADTATVGKVYGSPLAAAPPTPPYFLQGYSVNDNMHVLFVFE